MKETICAISTAPGVGGIAIIRLSGDKAFTLADKLANLPKGKQLAEQKANTTHYGTFIHKGQTIDQVIFSIFRAPHSFTGEDTVEIACHGSSYIQQAILQALVDGGARLALPGEFTQRAFLNGKMDLSQAEAVADLIASSSKASHRLALTQMKGGFSKELRLLREELLNLISLVELELDFGEEDVEFADRTQLKNLALRVQIRLQELADSFQHGNAIKHGIPVAIVGETNAGKSTLLNALLNEERAIVSDIHGTTRDTIEDVVTIHGQDFRFIDTAGIRTTSDAIEAIGIERTFQKLNLAQMVILLIDAQQAPETINEQIADIRSRMHEHQTLLVVFNKVDQHPLTDAMLEAIDHGIKLSISAKNEEGIDLLTQTLHKHGQLQEVDHDQVIVSNVRHYEALTLALAAITKALESLKLGLSGDLLSLDIRECIRQLASITGDIEVDDILGNIFANFCIGK